MKIHQPSSRMRKAPPGSREGMAGMWACSHLGTFRTVIPDPNLL